MNLKDRAKEFFALNLNPVPVQKGSKVPAREAHQTKIPEQEIDNYNWPEIGVSTGYASNNLEVLDWDLKNAEDPDQILQDFMGMVGKELLQKLVVQTTPSGGYHFIYRCDNIESNQKLAKNKQGLAIIETRGIGGYIKCWPSEGYTLEKGSFETIPYITQEERFNLFVSARKLNQLIKEDNAKRVPEEQREYQSKFPDYDSDFEIGMKLLEKHGWVEHSVTGEWVNYTRPGKSVSDGMSGGYNTEGNFFFAFSTSQDTFVTERPYDNHSLYAELECDGDYKKAYAKLFDQGHGVEDEGRIEALSFLSSEIEENEYLDQVRKGDIEHGLSTGFSELDDYFRFKRNSLNLGIGYDNIGKSLLMATMMGGSTVMHGWKWGVVGPENKAAENRETLIETLTGTMMEDLEQDRYEAALKYSRERFKIVSNEKHYSLIDVIEMGKRLYEYEGIDALLVDPWNFFAVEGDGYRHDNDVLSKLRVFVSNYCSVYIMAHPYSGATRTNLDKEGFLLPASKYEVQGGANFAYRVDDVFINHRIINHHSDHIRRTMQWIQEKVKRQKTGGKPHQKGDYTTLVYEQRDGFWGYWDSEGNNPMYKALTSRRAVKTGGLKDRVTEKMPF